MGAGYTCAGRVGGRGFERSLMRSEGKHWSCTSHGGRTIGESLHSKLVRRTDMSSFSARFLCTLQADVRRGHELRLTEQPIA